MRSHKVARAMLLLLLLLLLLRLLPLVALHNITATGFPAASQSNCTHLPTARTAAAPASATHH
jgi:hypothetical protein